MIKNNKGIREGKKRIVGLQKKIQDLADLGYLISDPTRLKILYLLKQKSHLCVTELADVLKVGISAVSHQLSLLERNNLVMKEKYGKIACYIITLNGKQFINRFNL